MFMRKCSNYLGVRRREATCLRALSQVLGSTLSCGVHGARPVRGQHTLLFLLLAIGSSSSSYAQEMRSLEAVKTKISGLVCSPSSAGVPADTVCGLETPPLNNSGVRIGVEYFATKGVIDFFSRTGEAQDTAAQVSVIEQNHLAFPYQMREKQGVIRFLDAKWNSVDYLEQPDGSVSAKFTVAFSSDAINYLDKKFGFSQAPSGLSERLRKPHVTILREVNAGIRGAPKTFTRTGDGGFLAAGTSFVMSPNAAPTVTPPLAWAVYISSQGTKSWQFVDTPLENASESSIDYATQLADRNFLICGNRASKGWIAVLGVDGKLIRSESVPGDEVNHLTNCFATDKGYGAITILGQSQQLLWSKLDGSGKLLNELPIRAGFVAAGNAEQLSNGNLLIISEERDSTANVIEFDTDGRELSRWTIPRPANELQFARLVKGFSPTCCIKLLVSNVKGISILYTLSRESLRQTAPTTSYALFSLENARVLQTQNGSVLVFGSKKRARQFALQIQPDKEAALGIITGNGSYVTSFAENWGYSDEIIDALPASASQFMVLRQWYSKAPSESTDVIVSWLDLPDVVTLPGQVATFPPLAAPLKTSGTPQRY